MTIGNDLNGRLALVSLALGRAIAPTLAAADAAVVVNGRHDRQAIEAVAAEIAAAGGQALAEVGDAAAVNEWTAAAIERFGRLDILINNVAVRPQQPLEQMAFSSAF